MDAHLAIMQLNAPSLVFLHASSPNASLSFHDRQLIYRRHFGLFVT